MDVRKLVGLVILIHLAAGASEDDSVEAIQDRNNSSKKGADEEVSIQLPTPTQLNISSGTQPGRLDSHSTGPFLPNSSGIKTTNVPRFQENKTPEDFRDISLRVSNKRTRDTGRNFRKRRIPKNRNSKGVPPYISTNLNIPRIYRKNKQDIEKQNLPDNHESGSLSLQKRLFPKFEHAKNTPDYTNTPKDYYFPNESYTNLPQIPEINLPPKPSITPVELPIPQLPGTNITHTPQTSSPEIEDISELKRSTISNPNDPDNTISEGQDFPTAEHPKLSTENISAIINTLINNISDSKVPQIIEITLSPVTPITSVEPLKQNLPLTNNTSTPVHIDSHPETELELPGVNKLNHPDSSVLQDLHIPELDASEIVNPVTRNISDINVPQIPTIAPKELTIPELPLTNSTHIPQIFSPQTQNVPELEVPVVNKPNYPDIPSPEGQDLPVVKHPKILKINMSTIVNPVLQNISDAKVQQIPVISLPTIPAITQAELPIPKLPVTNVTHIPQISSPQMKGVPEFSLQAINEPNYSDTPVFQGHDLPNVGNPEISKPNIPAIVNPVLQNMSDTKLPSIPDTSLPPITAIKPAELPIPMLPLTNFTNIPQFSRPQLTDITEVKQPVIIKPDDPDISILKSHDLTKVEHTKIPNLNISTLANPVIQNISATEIQQSPNFNIPPVPTVTPAELPTPSLPFLNDTHIPQLSSSPAQEIPRLKLTAIIEPNITSLNGQDIPIVEHPKLSNISAIISPFIQNKSDETVTQIPDFNISPVPIITPAELPIPKLPLTNLTYIPPISRPQVRDIPDLKQPTIIKPDDPDIPILESDDYPEVEHPQIPELNTSATVNPVIHNISNTKLHQIPDFSKPPVPTIAPLELPTVKLLHTNITHIPQINDPQIQDITKLNLPSINKPDYPDFPILEGHDLSTAENPEIPTPVNPVIRNISDTKFTPTSDIPLSPITPITPVELPIKNLPVTNVTQIPQNFIPQIQKNPELKVPPFSKPNYPDIPSPNRQDLPVVEHPKLQVINMSITVNPVVQNTSHTKVQPIPDISLPNIPPITQAELPIPKLTITNITYSIPKMSSAQIQEVPELKQPVINKRNYPDIPVLQGHDLPNAENHEILKPNVSTIVNPAKTVQIPDIRLPPIPTISPKELPISDLQFINVTETPQLLSPQTQDIPELNLTVVVKPDDIIIENPKGKDFPFTEQPTVNPVISNISDEAIPDTTLPSIIAEPPAEFPTPELPLPNVTNIPPISRPPLEDIPELTLPAVNKPNYPDIPLLKDHSLPDVEHPTIPKANIPTIANPVLQNMSGITSPSIPAIIPADLPVPNHPSADVTHIPQISTRQIQEPNVPLVEYPEHQELNRYEREKPLFSNKSGNQVHEIPDVEAHGTRAIYPPEIVTPHFPEVNITHNQQLSNPEITPVPNLNLQDIIRQIPFVKPETVNPKLPNISLPIFSQDNNKLNLTNIPALLGHDFPKDDPNLYLPIFLANANNLNYPDIPDIKIPGMSNLNISMVLMPVILKVNDTTAPEIHYVHSPHNPPITPLKLNFTKKSQRPILQIPAVPNLYLTLIASDCQN